MPTYRNRRYPRRKRRYTKRSNYSRSMTRYKRYGRNYNPIPHKSLLGNKRAVKMKYYANISINPTGVGLPGVYRFRANSLFDPDLESMILDHQPRGFDQIMPLYHHFVVIHSKIHCTFTNTVDIEGQVDGLTMNVGVALKATQTVQTSASDYLEGRNVSHGVIGGFQNGGPISRSITYSPKRFLSIPSPLTTVSLKGNSSANPSEDAIFHVFVAPIAFASDQGNIQVSVLMEFISVFTEPQTPGES